MGSRLGLEIFNMGTTKSKTINSETENNGMNQNLNQATTEIKNTIDIQQDTVVTILLVIVAILSCAILYFIYSKHMKCMKKKYTAPKPEV